MSYPQIGFQVRIDERASLLEMGERVEQVLQCRFTPHRSGSDSFDYEEILEANCLGLWITLSCDAQIPEGEIRNYCLMGLIRGDLEARWESEPSLLNISEYILGLLKMLDKDEWYIPDLQEIYTEAGLS